MTLLIKISGMRNQARNSMRTLDESWCVEEPKRSVNDKQDGDTYPSNENILLFTYESQPCCSAPHLVEQIGPRIYFL